MRPIFGDTCSRMAEAVGPPVVSAIIVVRNGIPYIGEAIESVLTQTFATGSS